MNAEICSKSKKFKKFYVSQKVSLLDFSVSFLTFQFFQAKIQKSNFSQKVALFDFSDSFHFDILRKNSKKSNFSQKVALFDFSGSFLTFRLFGQKIIMFYFSQKVALFAEIFTFHVFGQKAFKKNVLIAKSVTFRLSQQLSHFLTFRAKIQNVLFFAKRCTFPLFGQFSHFRFFVQKIEMFYFSRKVELLAEIVSLIFLGKKKKRLYFWQTVSRFDFSGKNSKSQTLRKKLHF